MAVLLECVFCAVLLWIAYQLYRFALIVHALKDVPRMRESFPFSLPLDLILQMRASRKRIQTSKISPVPLPKSKVYSRRFFKTLEIVLPEYYHNSVLCCFYGPLPFVHAFTAESAEAILSSPSNVSKKFSHHFLKPWLGNGLLSNPGDATWKVHRKMLTPTMHFRVLDDYLQAMNNNARRLLDKLSSCDNTQTNVFPIIRMCTFSILFESAFGIQLDEDDAEHVNFLADCDELADLILTRFVSVFHWSDMIFKCTKLGQRMKAASDRISSYIHKIVDMRLATLENNNELGKSFIDIVINMHNDGLLSRQDVRDHAATFIVGGFDTTATSLAFTLHLIANHPEVQEKLMNEVQSIIPGDGDITREQLKLLTYTEAVCKESLRLFPPLPLITRDITSPVRIGKHLIPAGTIGMVHIYHLHRNPHVWENPLEFRPSRFLESTRRHPYSFVPFSAGPRNCIGQKFANQEDKILLAHIMRAFKLATEQKIGSLRLSFELILRPLDGILIRPEPLTH